MPWTWRYEKADGTAITTDELQEAIFASQGDAESWLGERTGARCSPPGWTRSRCSTTPGPRTAR